MSRPIKQLLACISALMLAAGVAAAAEWEPLDASDLNLKAGRVDPNTDAEVLLWQIWVSDEISGFDIQTIHRNYVRLKVFNDKSAQKSQPPKIEYSKNEKVFDVAARVIQPDGSIQQLDKKSIFDQVLDKRKGRKDRGISLAIPNVKAGSIIEYQWSQVAKDESADHTLIEFWREYPVEKIVVH